MIKQAKANDVTEYVCDNCVKEAAGNVIIVFYPTGHIADSDNVPSHFCSDKCLREYTDKLIKKYGNWKSTPIIAEKKVRTSTEWREEKARKNALMNPPPKARTSPKTPKSKKPKTQEQENESNES